MNAPPPRPTAGLTRKTTTAPGAPTPDRPRVSVVIPCYNYARYLPDSVGSALGQEGVEVDVVVVDDCSTDDSVAVARALAAADPRVQVVAQPTNQGPVVTFNTGLTHVRGDYLVRLDADDLLTPGSLARSTALAQAYPSVGLVYGHPLHFSAEVPTTYSSEVKGWTLWPGGEWLAGRCADGFNVITSPEVLMRASVVAEVGGQQPLRHTHDMEMWFRIAAVSDVGYVRGADQAWHRDHAASLSMTHTDPLEELRERGRAFDTLFAGVAGRRPDAAALQSAARRALAHNALESVVQHIDRGRRDSTPTEAILAFAEQTDPGVHSTRAWRAAESRVRSASASPWSRVRAQVSARTFGLRGRLRYARWRRYGTYSGR